MVAGWSRDADGRLDFPLEYFTIIAFGLEAGREYRLQVARVEVVSPDLPVLTLQELDVPGKLQAGQTTPLALSFSLDKPGLSDEAHLVFRHDRGVDDATVLGTLPDGCAGLVLKQQDGWTAIYSAVPLLPTPLLRRIAALGRVHFFTAAGDVIWATSDLVGVSVHQAGPRTLNLPRSATVTDLYSGARLGENVRSFQADFADRATRVFVLR